MVRKKLKMFPCLVPKGRHNTLNSFFVTRIDILTFLCQLFKVNFKMCVRFVFASLENDYYVR